MKLTHNWLKDFVDIRLSAKELAQRLTMAGLEVTSLEKKGSDWVYEIEVTPNRPDLLSVIGIAREVAVLTNKKLHCPPVSPSSRRSVPQADRQTGRQADRISIRIENKKDCPLYTAKIIRDVKVGPSPNWLKDRLELVGLRSVNNIVDITNYVQLSLGQPLHAFDLDKIVSQSASQPVSQLEVIVRRARDKEEIVTIDGIKRILNDEILVIASGVTEQTGRQVDRPTGRPIAIAGIMGGEDSEVTHTTKNILLESAKFNPLIVRRGRQRLGLSTESSYRFERDIDVNTVEPASLYTARLIHEIAGGEFIFNKTKGILKTKNKKLTLHIPNINKLLGLSVPQKEVKRILKGLDCKIRQVSAQDLELEMPAFRKDIHEQIDLVEEIARHWGYEKIPLSLPMIRPSIDGNSYQDLLKRVRQLLISQGLNEVITYSLISKDVLNKADIDLKGAVEIVNPLSADLGVLRSQLLPSLLIVLSKNIRREEAVLIFEISKVFKDNKEELALGILLCGKRQIYLSSGKIEDSLSLFHLKGVIELLFNELGIKDYSLALENKAYLKKGQAIKLKVNAQDVGYVGQINENLSDSFDIKNKSVFATELCLDKILALAGLKKIFKPLPLYPSVRRDISLVIKESISLQDLLNAIKEEMPSLLKEVKVIDYYKGRHIPDGFKGLTLSCLYLSDERTLTDEEVNAVHITVCNLLKEKFLAQIR